jgi:hypothetical protein
LPADGESQAEVTVRILDNDGLPADEPLETITTTLGTLNYEDCAEGQDNIYVCTLTAPISPALPRYMLTGCPARGHYHDHRFTV